MGPKWDKRGSMIFLTKNTQCFFRHQSTNVKVIWLILFDTIYDVKKIMY